MKKLICLFTIICQVSLIALYAADEAGTNAQSEVTAPELQAKTTPEPQVTATAPETQPKAELQPKEANTANQGQLVPAKKVAQPVQTKNTEQPAQAKNVEQPPVQAKMVLREKVSDQNPLRKIARGTVNATLGWTEIPRQMIKVNKESGDIAGVFWGPLKGFAFFLGRTAVGVYEVTTFLLPPYKPVVNPEFILSDDNATDNE